MVTLLSLPQELRDSIILYSVLSTSEPPVAFDSAIQKQCVEPDDLNHLSRIGSKGVLYTSRPPITQASLLRTNHQLHDETEAVLERYHKRHGTHFALDIILHEEENLVCTWTSAPPLRKQVDSLDVTFRIQGISGPKNGFMDINGSTGPTIWRLYSVLERFLRCGPAAPTSRSCDRGLEVKRLRIKIQTPDLKNPKNAGYTISDEDVSPDCIPEHRAELPKDAPLVLINAMALARFMYIWMVGLLRMSDPDYALPGAPLQKYGGMLLKRLGSVTYYVDGWDKDHELYGLADLFQTKE